MSKEKDQLSKGLRALLTNIDKSGEVSEKKEELIKELSHTVADLPISNIIANPYQPRKDFDEVELLELVQSLKTHGLIQPITVRKLGEQFQIISGERRWRASKLAGLKSIPAYIRIADDQGMLEMAIVENIQRTNLNAMEVSIAYQRLIDECQLSHDQLATRVGKERSTVSNYLRLLNLPPKIQNALKSNKISMGHARAILGLENASWQLQIFEEVVKKNLSVRATESLVKSWKGGSERKKTGLKSKSDLHPEVRKIRNRLIDKLGAKIDIKRKPDGKGTIVIHFNSDEQFNDIVEGIE